jgi:hypothetical protein
MGPLTEFSLCVRTSPNKYAGFARIHAGAKRCQPITKTEGEMGKVGCGFGTILPQLQPISAPKIGSLRPLLKWNKPEAQKRAHES